jgi:hypothetical protein
MDLEDAPTESRVCLRRNLSKYFRLGAEADDVSDSTARSLLTNPSGRSSQFERAIRFGTVAALVSAAARQISERTPVKDAPGLVCAALDATSTAWTKDRIDVTDESAELLYRILEHSQIDSRAKLARSIVTN